jgi:16S rRNA (cytosine967-C5)-methyltransferase
MNAKSLVGHLNEIYNVVSSWEKPVDVELKKYYRSRKYLGSNDRKFISNNLYSIIRNHRLIIHIAEKHFSHLTGIDYFDKLFFINYTFSNVNNENVSLYIKEIFAESDELTSLIKEELNLVSNSPCLKYSFPDWMIDKFAKIISDQEMENFLASLNMNAPTTIRIVDKTFEQSVKKDFEERSILLFKDPIAPDAFIVEKRINFNDFASYKDGYFEVQDAGSQIVTLFVEPSGLKTDGNIKILDACAGAGGKSLYLSKLINKKGLVYAYDFDQKRLDAFKKRMSEKQMREKRIATKHGINIKPPISNGIIKFVNSEDELQTLKNKIDLLVLDVPCTGIGTIRRNPDLKWRLKEEDVLMYAKKQLSILETYSSYLKEGGRLIYITCSFFKEENEDVITHFLNKGPKFKLDDKTNFSREYSMELENSFLRLYPHRHTTDGFTACQLFNSYC